MNAGRSESALVTVVTGLPRSGTSMMMRMLAVGGCVPLVDGERPADAGNPQGYLEYAPVKRLHADKSWLPAARGKAVKVVAPLLPLLPARADDGSALFYRAIFMGRDMEDVLDSQRRLLGLLGRGHLAGSEAVLTRAFQRDLESARRWLDRHGVPVLDVDYRASLSDPDGTVRRLAGFIPGLDLAAVRAVLA